MRKVILRSGCLAAAFAGLSGFDHQPVPPPDYSPGYSFIEIVGPNGEVKRVLAPDACLTNEEPSPADLGEPRLPLGCANAFNLQRMVEDKRDLVQGRRLGPAPMGPAARAAIHYLNGHQDIAPAGSATAQPPATPNSSASTTKE